MSPKPDVDDLPPSPARSARASERSPDRGGASPMDTRPNGAAGAADAAAAPSSATRTGGATPGATGNVLEDAAVDTVLAAVTAAPAVVRGWYEGVSRGTWRRWLPKRSAPSTRRRCRTRQRRRRTRR